MTTGVQVTPVNAGPARTTRLAGPRQGWSSLVLLLVMLAVTGLAIDEQQWMGLGPDGTSQTAMLPWLMVAAGLTGAVLAWSRLSTGWVDLLAAIVGTGAGLLLASGAISSDPSLVVRLEAVNASLGLFMHDVLVTGDRTSQSSAFLLTVSALAWTSGVFAAISIFRRSHAAGAIVPIGAILLLQLLAAGRPQDIWLVIFAGASLLLVLRMDLEAQRDGWVRRRIGGGQGVGGAYLRGGSAVVGAMLVGSLVLTGTAGSPSVAAAFPQLDDLVDELASRVQGMVGVSVPSNRGSNGEFPKRQRIGTVWSPSTEVVFIAQPLLGGRHYWRSATYDAFDGREWAQTESSVQSIEAGEDLLQSSEDAVDEGSTDHSLVNATITSKSLGGSQLPAPQNPILLDRDARVSFMGDEGTFQELRTSDQVPVDGSYTVSGLEPAIDDPDGLTINRLVAAGDQYPDWLTPYRTATVADAGAATMEAAQDLRQSLPPDERDAYRVAARIQRYLAADPDRFRYSTDTRAEPCLAGETVPDCLLRTGIGYCQQYATTMAMMLRALEIPARYVQGFLPGTDIGEGQYEVAMTAGHAWVEVWFPEVGWIRFDPTPGATALEENGQQMTALPLGDPIPTPGPSDDATPDPAEGSFDPDATEDPFETAEPDASPDPAGTGAPTGDGGGVAGWLLIVAVTVLALAMMTGGVGLILLLRLPGRDPQLAWRGIVGLSTRLGAGPRASQTPYEYTASLSRVVPTAARDLRVVADAKVDASYAPPAGPGTAEMPGRPLRDAYRRARVGLLRLLVRRGR